VSRIAIWTATALWPIIASLAARRFGWRNVFTTSVLAVFMILAIIGSWIDLHFARMDVPTHEGQNAVRRSGSRRRQSG